MCLPAVIPGQQLGVRIIKTIAMLKSVRELVDNPRPGRTVSAMLDIPRAR
jgi:hypothetical protein